MTELELFEAALEQPASARGEFLDNACAGNSALRQRLEALLARHEKAADFLEIPAAVVATIERPVSERPGLRIGRYRLLEQIGEGGMGTVWVAEQTEPVKRRVALKLIKPGMDSRQVLSRFEAERQALALMDHPNIAKVFDGGMTDEGRPYFVMEYVKGMPITEYCDSVRLSIQDRLKLLIAVCQAVQHAHQKGIIHRDLKPSNILVCRYDGQPVPKVIDFGLAKATSQPLTEHTLYTAHGLMVGTPLYMSPEQAELNNFDVDTRTDIYSLGVVLYELLTGTTPLERQQLKDAAFQEILRLIKEVEPPRPSLKISSLSRSLRRSRLPGGTSDSQSTPNPPPTSSLDLIASQRSLEPSQLSRTIRGDLDWIVMKALEKDRSRRYETANGLARDIERYLHDDPVEAGPPSAAYRIRKLARKHRGLLTTVATIAVLLVFGTTVSTWQAIRATRAEISAKAAEDVARSSEQKTLLAAEAQQKARILAQSAEAAERSAKESALQREAETKAMLDFLDNRVIAAARPKGEPGGLGWDVTLRQALVAALPFIDNNFADQPLIEAQLRRKMGVSFWHLGESEMAANQLERARVQFTKHCGPDDVDTLRSTHWLTACYTSLGRHQQALELREEELVLRKAKLGLDHLDTLASMKGLAVSYAALERNEEALKLREETLTLAKAKLGPTHRMTLMTMNDFAQSHIALGRCAEALALCQETLVLYEATLGLDHPEALWCRTYLGTSYFGLGRHQEALKIRQETLASFKAVLGPDNHRTWRGMDEVAASLVSVGRSAEAVPIIDECVRRATGQELDGRLMSRVLDLRLRHYERLHDGTGCRATADMWDNLNRADSISLYTAARMRAVTAAVIRATDTSDVAAKQANAEADRAMDWLQKAIAAGYKDAAGLSQNKDFDSLRDRDDFKQLLTDLQAAKSQAPK